LGSGVITVDAVLTTVSTDGARLDFAVDPRSSIAHEVDDVAAVAALLNGPRLLVGHSSGAVVALEALAASPSMFAGAVVYEPPVVINAPLGGEALAHGQGGGRRQQTRQGTGDFPADIVQIPRGSPGSPQW
jgi:pimeloyl-ACP methyl ester carboxylesterase